MCKTPATEKAKLQKTTPALPGHPEEPKRESVIQGCPTVHIHISADMPRSFIICIGTCFGRQRAVGTEVKNSDLPTLILNVLWSQK